MPPASKGQLCQCMYQQCCNRTDRKTGEIGVELNSCNYRIHQEEERRHNMKKVMKAQQEVIETQEASIEDTLSQLSISQCPTAEVSRQEKENKYWIDQVWVMIAFYSTVLEDIAGQEPIINDIHTFPHDHPDLNQVYDALCCCRNARSFISRTEGDALRKITNRPLCNKPSVEAQRESCILKLCQLEDQVNGIEPFWLGQLEAHKKELEAVQALALMTYNTYNTGKILDIYKDQNFTILNLCCKHPTFYRSWKTHCSSFISLSSWLSSAIWFLAFHDAGHGGFSPWQSTLSRRQHI